MAMIQGKEIMDTWMIAIKVVKVVEFWLYFENKTAVICWRV